MPLILLYFICRVRVQLIEFIRQQVWALFKTRVRGALILFKVPICCCPTCTEGCIATHSTARIWLASLCCFCLSSERVALDGETVGVLLFIYIFIFGLEPGLVSGGSLQPAELDSIVRQYLTYECNLSSWHDSQFQTDPQIPWTKEILKLKRNARPFYLYIHRKHIAKQVEGIFQKFDSMLKQLVKSQYSIPPYFRTSVLC